MKEFNKNKLAYLFFISTIILIFLALNLSTELVTMYKKQNNLLETIQTYKTMLEQKDETIVTLTNKYRASADPTKLNEQKCPKFSDLATVDIPSTDKKYFYHYVSHPAAMYMVCDATDKENPTMLLNYEGRVQHGDWIVTTIYGDLLFYANTKDKTLNYLSTADFPFITSDMFFFGPQANDTNSFSPDANKVVIGISDGCHDCDTIPIRFVLNLITGGLQKLGTASHWEWLDDNTVKWMELNIRNRTPEEYEQDPYAFPVVVEEKGYVITKL